MQLAASVNVLLVRVSGTLCYEYLNPCRPGFGPLFLQLQFENVFPVLFPPKAVHSCRVSLSSRGGFALIFIGNNSRIIQLSC